MKLLRAGIPQVRQVALVLGAVALAAMCGLMALLVAADRGLLDPWFERWASHQLGRPVRFGSLKIQLLQRQPHVEILDLAIANPEWLGRGTVAEAKRVSATLGLGALLQGSFRPTGLTLSGLELHLVRAAEGKNNWTFGSSKRGGPAFEPLRSVERLSIVGGTASFDDARRQLRAKVTFSHSLGGSMPFQLRAEGELAGSPFVTLAQGAALNGPGVGRPYFFTAQVIDGKTIVDVRGTSENPFDFAKFELAIKARGPNLASLGYLFNLRTANTRPFALQTVAKGEAAHFAFDPLHVRFGDSDITGWVRSDHSGARHRATANLSANLWTRDDLRAVLAPLPPHKAARNRSGAVAPAKSHWLLSDEPFPTANLRALDVQAQIRVSAIRGYPFPLNGLNARVDLAAGRLSYRIVKAEIHGGQLAARGTLDVRSPQPMLRFAGELRGLQLAAITARTKAPMSGRLSITTDLRGRGRSIHEAAAAASGSMTVRVAGGSVPAAPAFMLGGDMLRSLRSLGNGRSATPLECLSASFTASHGTLTTNSVAIRTAAGDTVGSGTFDLAGERIRFILRGHPRERKLFRLAMPIRIEGPLARPTALLLPSYNAEKLGLRGKLGIALSPVASLLPLGGQEPVVARCK